MGNFYYFGKGQSISFYRKGKKKKKRKSVFYNDILYAANPNIASLSPPAPSFTFWLF